MNEGEKNLPLDRDADLDLVIESQFEARVQTAKEAVEYMYATAGDRLSAQPVLRARTEKSIETMLGSLAKIVEAIPAEEAGEARIVAFLEGLASMTSTGAGLFHKDPAVAGLNKGPQRQVFEDDPGLKVGDDLDK